MVVVPNNPDLIIFVVVLIHIENSALNYFCCSCFIFLIDGSFVKILEKTQKFKHLLRMFGALLNDLD